MSGAGSGPGDDDLEQLIAEFQRSGLRELHVRRDGLELYLSNDPAAAGLGEGGAVAVQSATTPGHAAPAVPQAAPTPPAGAPIPEGSTVVAAPYLGTFYRAPKPGSAPYVEVGDRVGADTEICLVEVMKLFTAVRAGTAGTIAAILASDGAMVAADQPLFAIRPD